MSNITNLPDDITARIFHLADTPIPVIRSLSRNYRYSQAISIMAAEPIKAIAKLLKLDSKSLCSNNKPDLENLRDIFERQYLKLCSFSKKALLDENFSKLSVYEKAREIKRVIKFK